SNLSPYYQIPLINNELDLLEELENRNIVAWEGPEADPDFDSRDVDNPARTDFMQAPRFHKPSHNIVLHLWNRNYTRAQIAEKLQSLDPRFIRNFSGWVWKGLFIPEYYDMTKEKIDELMVLAPAPMVKWEKIAELKGRGEEFVTNYLEKR